MVLIKFYYISSRIKNPKFLKEAVKNLDHQLFQFQLEANKKTDGKYYCFYDYGRETSGFWFVKDWFDEVQSRGVGEIILTSISKDGTGEGFDKELLNIVNDKIKLLLFFMEELVVANI